MFKEFAADHFNNDRGSALRCIAHEMAAVDYKKTGNLDNCHTMFSELEDSDKVSVYNYFMDEHSTSKTVSLYNETYNSIQSGSYKYNKKGAYVKMILSVLGCCVSVALSLFVILTKEDFLIRYLVILAPVVPILFAIMIQRIIINIRYQKIMEYFANRNYLEAQVKDLI
ncbi:MAG: hypothetical protein IJT91_00010 [Clostridia bacterium]|nr:hypothetical protein [Clostridia bacterium]